MSNTKSKRIHRSADQWSQVISDQRTRCMRGRPGQAPKAGTEREGRTKAGTGTTKGGKPGRGRRGKVGTGTALEVYLPEFGRFSYLPARAHALRWWLIDHRRCNHAASPQKTRLYRGNAFLSCRQSLCSATFFVRRRPLYRQGLYGP